MSYIYLDGTPAPDYTNIKIVADQYSVCICTPNMPGRTISYTSLAGMMSATRINAEHRLNGCGAINCINKPSRSLSACLSQL